MKKYLILLIFFILNSAFIIQNSFSQWVQQSVPVTSGIFFDMKFVNANTGFIAHSTNVLLKTTDAGYNWVVNKNGRMSSLTIVDSLYLYGVGYNNQYGKLYKSTNGGITWDSSLSSFGYSFWKSYFLNRDTGLISSSDSYNNQIWMTTDGGQTKQLVATLGGASQGTFHFLKEKVNGEYYGWYYFPGNRWISMTTNSGLNWISKPDLPENINSVFFINKDTGWATAYWERNFVFYTTNGGNNWMNKSIPNPAYCFDIVFVNSRKGWISGNSNNKIFATDNSGNNWGYQNTGGSYSTNMFFLDSLNGWVKSSFNTLSHTIIGGGPITSVFTNYIDITSDYKLFQNYPNPFNNSTIISYQLQKSGVVNLKVFDISGKEVISLVNKNQNAGKYEVTFNSGTLSSGIYFYSLSINNEKLQVKKMILNK